MRSAVPGHEQRHGADHAGTARAGRWRDALIAAGVLLLALDVGVLLTRAGGLQLTSSIDGIAYLAAAVLAAVLTAARARAPATASERAGWVAMTIGSALFVLGVLVSIYQFLVLGRPYTFPSLSDTAYLPAELLWTAAVVLLAGGTMATARLRLLLDGGLVATSLGYLSWVGVMRPIYESDRSSLVPAAVALAYPIVNVTQTVIVVLVISFSRQLNTSMLFIGLSTLLIGISTSMFATSGNTHPSDYDALDVAAFVAIMIGARIERRSRPVPPDAQLARWQTLLPYAPLLMAAPVALDNLFRDADVDLISRVLLCGLVAAVLLRQLAVVLEARSLAASLARTSAEQRLLIEQAPVGICRLDGQSRILTVNRYLETMLGSPGDPLAGRALLEILQAGGPGAAADLLAGPGDRAGSLQSRIVRADGSALWCSTTVGTIRGSGGRAESSVAIVEDITDRMLQVERAAAIQRALLPETVPTIPGYELAGACRPAEDVAGDLYDWVLTPEGRLDVTVADVMGKGMGAALVMAILHTALRSDRGSLGPAGRAGLAAEAMGRGVSRDGLFVTMFEMSLDPPTGVLRYVDAGHGHCAIRRPDGELVPLSERSLPLGVRDHEAFVEGTATLDPADALVIYSDGLVERADRTLDLRDFDSELAEMVSAADTVSRLMARMPARPADDVTIVVLRRLPSARLAPGIPGRAQGGRQPVTQAESRG